MESHADEYEQYKHDFKCGMPNTLDRRFQREQRLEETIDSIVPQIKGTPVARKDIQNCTGNY